LIIIDNQLISTHMSNQQCHTYVTRGRRTCWNTYLLISIICQNDDQNLICEIIISVSDCVKNLIIDAQFKRTKKMYLK